MKMKHTTQKSIIVRHIGETLLLGLTNSDSEHNLDVSFDIFNINKIVSFLDL